MRIYGELNDTHLIWRCKKCEAMHCEPLLYDVLVGNKEIIANTFCRSCGEEAEVYAKVA